MKMTIIKKMSIGLVLCSSLMSANNNSVVEDIASKVNGSSWPGSLLSAFFSRSSTSKAPTTPTFTSEKKTHQTLVQTTWTDTWRMTQGATVGGLAGLGLATIIPTIRYTLTAFSGGNSSPTFNPVIGVCCIYGGAHLGWRYVRKSIDYEKSNTLQVAELTGTVSQLDTKLESLQKTSAEQKTTIDNHAQRIETLEGNVQELKKSQEQTKSELADLKKRVDLVENQSCKAFGETASSVAPASSVGLASSSITRTSSVASSSNFTSSIDSALSNNGSKKPLIKMIEEALETSPKSFKSADQKKSTRLFCSQLRGKSSRRFSSKKHHRTSSHLGSARKKS